MKNRDHHWRLEQQNGAYIRNDIIGFD